MKLSKYNLEITNGSTVLVFNTRTGNYIRVPSDIYKEFKDLKFDNESSQKFKDLGFYISGEEDEFKLLQNDCNNKLIGSKIHKYRILTTTGCNAKCPYCYEKGVIHSMMTEDIAESIVQFIISDIHPGEKLRIEWFGGEPLLNKNVIDYISEKIINTLPKDVDFVSNMITNGYLITPLIVQKMKSKWKLKHVQITLDGKGEIYEKIKGLGRGSFDKIISVIKLLTDNKIKVDIRINFDSYNIDKIEELLDYLSKASFNDKINVYPAKIFSNSTKRGYFDLEEETIKIYKLLRKYGFRKGIQLIPRSFHTSCMASYPHFYTISPQGKIFKCDRQFLDKNSIADVRNRPKSKDLIKYVKSNNTVAEKCTCCVLYPLCWGGCYYDRENNIYPCYLTKKIVLETLKMALDDLETQDVYK